MTATVPAAANVAGAETLVTVVAAESWFPVTEAVATPVNANG